MCKCKKLRTLYSEPDLVVALITTPRTIKRFSSNQNNSSTGHIDSYSASGNRVRNIARSCLTCHQNYVRENWLSHCEIRWISSHSPVIIKEAIMNIFPLGGQDMSTTDSTTLLSVWTRILNRRILQPKIIVMTRIINQQTRSKRHLSFARPIKKTIPTRRQTANVTLNP